MKLMEEVRQTLSKLADLMQREREAVTSGSDEEMMAIDKDIEHKLGEKERQMGALRQHRKEHGC
jgi:hypothetical protein